PWPTICLTLLHAFARFQWPNWKHPTRCRSLNRPDLFGDIRMDLADILKLASPLPVSAYFDQAVYEQEQQHIFRCSPLYVGHQNIVPQAQDWYALPQENGGRVLVHNADGIKLMSNVCRHRQALMLGSYSTNCELTEHRGSLGQTGGNIVCPVHAWTYRADGELLSAPQFEIRQCKKLESSPLL